MNTYAYVGNNPLVWIDPDGLQGNAGVLPGDWPNTSRPTAPNPTSDAIKDAIRSGAPDLIGRVCLGAMLLLHTEPYDPEFAACDANPMSCPMTKSNDAGPSGKPKRHNVDHPSRKRAKDAARNEGKGPPINHPSPQRGKPHYHPTDADGNKIPGAPHHNYPD